MRIKTQCGMVKREPPSIMSKDKKELKNESKRNNSLSADRSLRTKSQLGFFVLTTLNNNCIVVLAFLTITSQF